MKITKLAVIGAGLMGSGIAQVAAQAGLPVTVRDIEQPLLERAAAKLQANLERARQKGRLDEAGVQSALGRLSYTTDLAEALEGASYVIEAVPEQLELKKAVFTEMDQLAASDTILASNTSELSISALAAATSRPQLVIGTHWFYPPQVMKLIEVVKTGQTSLATLETTLALCARLGKETVVCGDAQGFITSRAISALIAECLRIYEDGLASIEDIDKAMRLGFNHPIGPFQLIDMSGADVAYFALKGLSKVYGERFAPSKTLKELVDKKQLGQKTGRGFYNYD